MKASGLVLSANARVGVGGQGLNLEHMVEALRDAYPLTVFARASQEPRSVNVPAARASASVLSVPFLRRRRDWITLLDDRQFDRYVANHMPEARILQGVVGQCAQSMEVAKSRRMRTVLDVVNTHVDDFHGHVVRESRKFGLYHMVHPETRKRILSEYALADVVRVMSERAARTFAGRGFPMEKLVVATPPIDSTGLPQAQFKGPFRLSFVGLLEPWKGFHYLLEAFDRLELPEAELIFWGGPGSRSASAMLDEYQARNRRIAIRPVPIRSVGFEEVYGKTSVLVHPSLSDGFSYAVAEAMACGVPVIVTDNTGAADLVVDGESGYIVPIANVDALAERIERFAREPKLLPRMGAKARDAVRRLTPEAFRAPLLKRLAQFS